MGKIYIDHLYLCSSYNEAKELSKQFLDFKVVLRSLGVKRTIYPKCYIRKKEKSNYSHVLSVKYKFEFIGEFANYGFVDKRTLLKYPDIPKDLLKVEDKFDRWKVLFDRTVNDDECFVYDPEYYVDFDSYFKEELKFFIDKLFLTEVIALPYCKSGGIYTIYYEEDQTVYQKIYSADKSSFLIVKNFGSFENLETLDIQKTWDWINKYRKYKKDDWRSEVRPLTALSYAINREPFEQFFYAILGLESVYTNGNRKATIKEQLKIMLPKVFAKISADDIEELYSFRSDFVHGNIKFPNYYDTKTLSHMRYDYIESANKADFLLLRTIQLLVKNDAYKIRNDGSDGIVFVSD